MSRIWLSLSFWILLSPIAAFAQRQNVYLLKKDGTNAENRDSASYMKIVSEPDSGTRLFNVKEYYKNGKPKFVGKSSAIDTPAFQDQFVLFYSNGKKKALGSYKNGLLIDDEYEYYPNGKPYLTKKYSGKYNSAFEDTFDVIAYFDSLGNDITKEKSTTISYKKTSAPSTDTSKITAFLKSNLIYPKIARENNIMGEVRISIVVANNGKILNCNIIRAAGPDFIDEIVKVLKSSPDWVPENIYDSTLMKRYSYSVIFILNSKTDARIIVSPIYL